MAAHRYLSSPYVTSQAVLEALGARTGEAVLGAEAVRLYRLRWRIEEVFRALKSDGLGLELLRQTPRPQDHGQGLATLLRYTHRICHRHHRRKCVNPVARRGRRTGYCLGMIESHPDSDSVAAAAIAAGLSTAIAARGFASLVATGGRSPGPVYDRLAFAEVDWAQVTVTLSDDRCLGERQPDSNAWLVRTRLLQGPAAAARFLTLWPAPAPAAVRALMPFDVAMLGMGEDGHIASLIPGDPGLEDALTTADLLREVPEGLGKPPLARITLTLSAILSARAIFLLIAGEAKREVIARAAAGEDLPVGRLITQADDRLRIFWTPGD